MVGASNNPPVTVFRFQFKVHYLSIFTVHPQSSPCKFPVCSYGRWQLLFQTCLSATWHEPAGELLSFLRLGEYKGSRVHKAPEVEKEERRKRSREARRLEARKCAKFLSQQGKKVAFFLSTLTKASRVCRDVQLQVGVGSCTLSGPTGASQKL